MLGCRPQTDPESRLCGNHISFIALLEADEGFSDAESTRFSWGIEWSSDYHSWPAHHTFCFFTIVACV
jgi:hypothetical protein